MVWAYPAARHIGGDTLKMFNLHDEKYWPSSIYPNLLEAENFDKHYNGNLSFIQVNETLAITFCLVILCPAWICNNLIFCQK